VRVLIAEDDVTSRLLLKKVLVSWGYDVIVTKDGGEALKALEAEDAPHLAILDWMMPVMDGVDVCRQIRTRETQQPPYIILLTALDDTDDVVAGLEAGADDYVGKPYHPDELRARVAVGRRLVEAQRALEVLASTDVLTGVLNRRAIMEELEKEAARAARAHSPLGVGMLDIDHFKRVNDTYGHAAGDVVLREVVNRAGAVLRPYDRLGRFGGEEFLVIVPGPDHEQIGDVLERLREAVERAPVSVGELEVPVTVSLGGVECDSATCDDLILRADAALYEAKDQGRNRVVVCRCEGDTGRP